ncbi:hypothetical protein, partial [Yersinia enterocolitica]|uniref:hypothetical protein n=1 Tax=Yersinia enterocolitica TaxID=630 RepID=UPI001E305A51
CRKSWSVHFIILGADALLFYLSSPYNIESSRFVSSLTHSVSDTGFTTALELEVKIDDLDME